MIKHASFSNRSQLNFYKVLNFFIKLNLPMPGLNIWPMFTLAPLGPPWPPYYKVLVTALVFIVFVMFCALIVCVLLFYI